MKNGKYELLIAPINYPGKKYRDRYAYEHILVWWEHTGSVPPSGMEIHHKNGNHRDNRIDNLELVTGHEHRKIHGAIATKNSIKTYQCGSCGKDFERQNRNANTKLRLNKYNKLFCSRSCGTKHQQLKMKEHT